MIGCHVTGLAENINLKAAPGTLSIVQPRCVFSLATPRFIPLFAFVHLRTMTGGALTTSPGIRLGTNANHNDVCPQFIPSTSIAVGQIGSIPLTSPLQAPPISTNDIFVEITQSAIGPTSMTADVLLIGIIVG